MQYSGNILKMETEFTSPVTYYLPIGEKKVLLNDILGKEITLNYKGRINCIVCGKITRTSHNQGFCYSCLQAAPEAGESVLRPELSRAHLGIARDMEWAQKNDLVDHFVYLSLTSNIKVGVTRFHQVPNRWIDQGAWKAIRLAKTPNRYLAGQIEVALKAAMNDKTNWRHMLTNQIERGINLLEEKSKASQLLPEELSEYLSPNDEILEIRYPVRDYPEKVKSVGFDKMEVIGGQLSGIKGQYLIFSDGSVLNIRKHNGYLVNMEI